MKIERKTEYHLTLTEDEARELRTFLGHWPEKEDDEQYPFSVEMYKLLDRKIMDQCH